MENYTYLINVPHPTGDPEAAYLLVSLLANGAARTIGDSPEPMTLAETVDCDVNLVARVIDVATGTVYTRGEDYCAECGEVTTDLFNGGYCPDCCENDEGAVIARNRRMAGYR